MNQWIILQTHDRTLDISRLERIMAVLAVVVIVTLVDYLMGGFTAISLFGLIIGQLAVLKCWHDMVHKRQPNKNCWEFKE